MEVWGSRGQQCKGETAYRFDETNIRQLWMYLLQFRTEIRPRLVLCSEQFWLKSPNGDSRIARFSSPTDSASPSISSSTNLQRFSWVPPYSSVLVLMFEPRSCSGRYPFPVWSSTLIEADFHRQLGGVVIVLDGRLDVGNGE
jgi:hypothetical protein